MNSARGITFRSLGMIAAGLVVSAVLVQFLAVFDAPSSGPFGSEAIPLSALLAFAAVLAPVLAAELVFRRGLLSRAERLCVIYALLLAGPLMALGFWRLMLSSASTVVRANDFAKYDALNRNLFPHGPNLLAGRFTGGPQPGVETAGAVRWTQISVRPGVRALIPVLSNPDDGGRSAIRFRIDRASGLSLAPRQTYMVTALVRTANLGGRAAYQIRIMPEADESRSRTLLSGRQDPEPTVVQPHGFVREGFYGIDLGDPEAVYYTLEFALDGAGSVELGEIEFLNVSALEDAFKGRRLMEYSQWRRLPDERKDGWVVMPEKPFTPDWFLFLASGFFPAAEWLPVLGVWGGFVALLLAATFAAACLFRRQWMQSERYPLPLGRIPFALVTWCDGQERPFWRNRAVWVGFGLALFYCLLVGGHAYFPAIPRPGVSMALKAYLPDPAWGRTWDDVQLNFRLLFFLLGLFLELNVLLSLVAGFFLFRFQYWFGEATGLTGDPKYPYPAEQIAGAWFAFGALILATSRRFLAEVVRDAWRNVKTPGEALSPRGALLLFLASAAGVAVWSCWAGFRPAGMMVWWLMLAVSMLAMARARAECGYPDGGLAHSVGGTGLAFAAVAVGGYPLFGAEGLIFTGLFCGVFAGYGNSSFWVLPGLQVELVELGRRLGVRRADIAATMALGLLGGIFVGGWAYLSGACAIGADNFPIPGHFGSLRGNLAQANAALARATELMDPATAPPGHLHAEWFGLAAGAAGTAVCVILRQINAAFWFHPLGFVLGSSVLIRDAWGSLFFAWAVRLAVLKIGGATAVRRGLIPAALGGMAALIVATAFFSAVQAYIYFFSYGSPKFNGQF